MSILIKGMVMPKSCETCELSSTDSSGFFGCYVTGNIVMRKREQDRPSWCPITEVPPHGRLIDADALMKYAENVSYKDEWHMTVTDSFVSVENIVHAPTIIESEGEE